MNTIKKVKEWLRKQWWYQQYHHFIVFILSGFVGYVFASLGRKIDAHWMTFLGGMVFMAGIMKLYEYYFGKNNEDI